MEYVFSDLSGIHVASTKGKVHTQLTLKVFEEKTPLVRCHRQYLISPKAIAEIEAAKNQDEINNIFIDPMYEEQSDPDQQRITNAAQKRESELFGN